MIRVSARASATPQEMSDILSGRLLALATVHALVRRTFDCNRMASQGADLHEIVCTIRRPDDGAGVRFKIEGPPIRLVIDRQPALPHPKQGCASAILQFEARLERSAARLDDRACSSPSVPLFARLRMPDPREL